jgi:hypothetical protein
MRHTTAKKHTKLCYMATVDNIAILTFKNRASYI